MGRFGIGFLFVLTTVGATIAAMIAMLYASLQGRIGENLIFIPFVAFAPLALMAVMSCIFWLSRKITDSNP